MMTDLIFANENIEIKPIRGIYFLFYDDELVYIGQSENVHKRVPCHIVDKKFNNWNYIEYPEEDLDELEAEYILKYQPKYNQSIPKNNTWLSSGLIKIRFGIGKRELKKLIKTGEFATASFCGVLYVRGIQ